METEKRNECENSDNNTEFTHCESPNEEYFECKNLYEEGMWC